MRSSLVAALRWLDARREELFVTLLWPAAPAPFNRHLAFRRLAIYLFLYNLIVMWLTIHLTFLMVDRLVSPYITLIPAGARDFSVQSIRWLEGLIRYIIWTALNFPLALKFRRMWYDDLLMAGRLPGLGPALLFGRPIFWASLVATFLASETLGSPSVRQLSYNQPAISLWMTGKIGLAQLPEVVHELRELLHTAAVSIFRAAAITYALFAGMKVRGAVGRIIVVYVIGGLLLFVTHTHADRIGREQSAQAWNQQMTVLRQARQANAQFVGTLQGYLLRSAEAAGASMLERRELRRQCDRFRATITAPLDLRIAGLAQNASTWRMLWMLRFFIPYYFVALGGASFLLFLTRSKTRYSHE
jgi:hypothetical protein